MVAAVVRVYLLSAVEAVCVCGREQHHNELGQKKHHFITVGVRSFWDSLASKVAGYKAPWRTQI